MQDLVDKATMRDAVRTGYKLMFDLDATEEELDRFQDATSLTDLRTRLMRRKNSIDLRDIEALEKREKPFVFFIHVPKTGGSTFRAYLRSQLKARAFTFERGASDMPADRVKPNSGDFFACYDRRNTSLFSRYDVMIGHYQYQDIPRHLLTTNSLLTGSMRDPVARIVSLYGFIRRVETHPLYRQLKDRTLAQALKDVRPFRTMSSNAQLRFLTGAEDYDGACRALDRHRYLIGKTENIDEYRKRLCEHIGIAPEIEFAGNVNVNPAGYVSKLSLQPDYDQFMEDAKHLTAEEQRFYDRFDSLLER